MKRNCLLFVPAVAGVTVSGCGQAAQPKPNIVFFLTDDFGICDLGCYGSTFYETPNVDALASDGVLFTNGYASCPVSSPTRASIMTGKHPARVGITDWIPGRQAKPNANDPYCLVPPEFTLNLPLFEYTLGEAFRDNGYQTLFVGKWHLGGDKSGYPEYQGFDVNIGGGSFGQPPKGYFSPYGLPHLEDGPKGEYLTERLADECVKLLDGISRKRPFFLYYSFYQVHTPLQAKADKVEYFTRKAERMGLTEANSTTKDRDWIHQIPVDGKFVERTRQGHPVYAAMISHMDDAVGKVINKLKEMGVYDNTIIIFTSDNGGLATAEGSPTSNAPYRAGKGWAYEGGVREPVIVRWPGVATGGRTNASQITSSDFFPTLLDMAGCPLLPERHVDGVSFKSALTNGAILDRGPMYWHYPHYSNQGGRPYGAVQYQGYKLIQNYETMNSELYNVADDISETKDVSALYPEKVKEMTAMLEEWRTEVGADMPVRK